MSCILRVGGRAFDVDRYLSRSPFRAVTVFRRGEPKFPASQPLGRKLTISGCNIEVSRKDLDDFAGQIRDAIRFLRKHGPAVRKLRRYRGVDGVTLDFGIVWRDVAVQGDFFPETLVSLAGKCRLGLEVSHYPMAEEETTGTQRSGCNVTKRSKKQR